MILPFDPVLQERGRRQISQAGVAAAPVVEHGDVLEQIARGLVSGRVAHAMHSLILEAVEEALSRCVVPAVTLARHRTAHAVGSQAGLVSLAGVLTTPIGVK